MQAVPLQLPQTMEHCIPCFLQLRHIVLHWLWQLQWMMCSRFSGAGNKSVVTGTNFFPSPLFRHKIIACSFPLLHLVIHTIAVELGCSWRWWQSLGLNLGWVSGHFLSNILVSYTIHSYRVYYQVQQWKGTCKSGDGKKVKDHCTDLLPAPEDLLYASFVVIANTVYLQEAWNTVLHIVCGNCKGTACMNLAMNEDHKDTDWEEHRPMRRILRRGVTNEPNVKTTPFYLREICLPFLSTSTRKGKPCLYSACTLWRTAKIVGKAAGAWCSYKAWLYSGTWIIKPLHSKMHWWVYMHLFTENT